MTTFRCCGLSQIGQFSMAMIFVAFLSGVSSANATPNRFWSPVSGGDSQNSTGVEVLLLSQDGAVRILNVRKTAGHQKSSPTFENPSYELHFISDRGEVLKVVPFEVEERVYGAPPKNEQEVHTDHGKNHVARVETLRFTVSTSLPKGASRVELYDRDENFISKKDLPRSLVGPKEKPRLQKVRGDEFLRGRGHSSSFNVLDNINRFMYSLFELSLPSAYASSGDTIEIVFVGDRYDSSEMQKFSNDVDRFVSRLLSLEPFKSHADKFTFYKLENTASLDCNPHSSIPRLLMCDYSLVTGTVNDSGLSYDKIVVIVDTGTYGGGGGSYAVSYNGSYGCRSLFMNLLILLGDCVMNIVCSATQVASQTLLCIIATEGPLQHPSGVD